jgi:hypothetical protein
MIRPYLVSLAFARPTLRTSPDLRILWLPDSWDMFRHDGRTYRRDYRGFRVLP